MRSVTLDTQKRLHMPHPCQQNRNERMPNTPDPCSPWGDAGQPAADVVRLAGCTADCPRRSTSGCHGALPGRVAPAHARRPIYVSPLPRARSTAAAIAAALAITPVVTEGLREFSIGDWEGRTYRDLIDNEDLWGRWRADPGFAPPNGESPRSFTARVLHDLTPLVAKHPGELLLFVSHGGVIGCLLDAWLGEGRGDWAHGNRTTAPSRCWKPMAARGRAT